MLADTDSLLTSLDRSATLLVHATLEATRHDLSRRGLHVQN